MLKPELKAVDNTPLPDYPIPRSERLESHYFVEFHHNRWRDSDFRMLADLDVRAVGFDLFFLAQNQAPVGTLPTDGKLLAKLSGVDLETWNSLCSRPISPLHNWCECNCEGEVRLAHPVVTEMAVKALGYREDHLEKKEADRERHRLKALPAQMVRGGASTRMAEDEALVIRFDQFLLEHCPDQQRRGPMVRAALEKFDLQGRNGAAI